jgi:ABC-type lipoprotein export system ATPase subunit
MDRVVTIRDGRTSTEIRRRRDREDGSLHEEEWVILDPAGRLQLPRIYIDTLEMQERVRVRLEEDHVSVWPHGEDEPKGAEVVPDVVSRAPAILQTDQSLGLPIRTEGLSRTFPLGVEEVHALEDVNLEVSAGTFTAVVGPSGSGKTTLLNLIGGLDRPSQGTVLVGERSLADMTAQDTIEYRRHRIGFVFQTFGLLPFLSVAENVQVPLRLLGVPRQARDELTKEVLALVGLAERAGHRTYELSGGEQQRVAVARALVKRPAVILADEPTGQLDTLTGASIISLLREIVEQTGVTAIVASHDPNVRERADRVAELKDGRLVG